MLIHAPRPPRLDDLRNFPDEARRAAGFELRAVQNGVDPSDWRPMQAVGPGAREIKRADKISDWLAKGTGRLESNS
jgi:phage-related protein